MVLRGVLALLRDHQVFAHRERCKDAAPLRDEADPELRDALGAEPFDRAREQPDLAAARFQNR